MVDHAPRDFDQWMKSVERRLMAASRAASNLPFTYNEKLKGDILADKLRHPTAPVEITWQTAFYTPDGLATQYARLMVDFPDVTKATDGTDIPIKEYELWIRDDTTNYLQATTDSAAGLAAPGLTIPGLASTPAMVAKEATALGPFKRAAVSSESSLRVDGLIPGTIYTFRVRAIGRFTTAPGEWSNDFQAQMDADTTPPPQPTAPLLTVSRGTIAVRWDGLSVNGSMPGDFSHLIVAYGTSSSPINEEQRFFRGGGNAVISDADYYTPVFVRFRAVDYAGNSSPWSEQAVAYTVPLVDTDVILSELDGNTTAIRNIGAEAIKDGAVLKEKLADGAVSLGKLESAVQTAVQSGTDAMAVLGPLQVEVSGTRARLETAETDMVSSKGRLDTAESQLTDAFGQLGTVDTRIDTAKQATLTTAASDAQTKADTALAAANAQIAQIIARGQSLVRNGDFEAGQDGWAPSAFAVPDTSMVRSGTKSMKIGPNPGGNVWPVSEWVPGSTGRTYYLEGWFRRTGTESIPAGVGFVLQAKTAAGGTATFTIGTVDSSAISTTAFTKVSITYTLATADTVSVRFAPWIKAGNNVYNIDDILVVDVTEAQAALTAANNAQGTATAAQTAAGNAQSTATDALTMATSKSKVYYSTSTPSGTGTTTGDLWRQRDDSNAIIGEWQWDSTLSSGAGGWVKQTVSGSNVSNMDIGFLTAGAATMSQALINKLVAGTANFQTVDVKNLFATASTMQTAVIDKLWTDVVNSRKITADMVLISKGANLLTDPDIQDVPGWAAGTLVTIATTGGMTGRGSVTVGQDAVQRGSYYAASSNIRRSKVVAGGTYRIGMWVYPSADMPAASAKVYLRLYNDTTGNIIAPDVPGAVPQNTAILPANTWSFVAGMVTVPAGSVYTNASFGMFKQTTYSTGTVIFSDPVLQQAMAGELIVDGSVTAGKVAANAITAKNIVVGDFTNLAVGSDFEDASAVPWTLASQHTISTTQKKYGTSSLRLGPVADAAVPGSSVFIGDLRVKEAEQWYFKLWVYLDASFNGDTNSKLRISNQAGTPLSTTITYNAVTKAAWTMLDATLTVPAGTTSLQLQLWNTNTAGYAYIDDIQVRRVAEPSLIQNLGVEKLTASTATMSQAVIDKLWADVVRSKKITTDMLVVSGENLMPNGFGENLSNASWSAWTWDGADKPPGTFGSFTYSTQATVNLANDIAAPPVEGNTEYLLEGWIKASVAGSKVYIEALETGGANPTPVYPLNNYDVPTVWTKFSVVVKTDPGNTAMRFRMFANHVNGTVTNATQKLAGLTYRKRNGAGLVATGGINTDALAAEAVTAGKIKALDISAGQLAANAVEADKIKAGAVIASKLEATLALVTEIAAGPVTGEHASMDPTGFKVYTVDPDDGSVDPVVSLGTANADDYFQVSDSSGQVLASMNKMGAVLGQTLEAKDALYYKGTELQETLDALPKGIIGWNQFGAGSTWPTLGSAGGEVGLFEIGWETPETTPRMYAVNVPPLLIKSLSGSTGRHGLVMRYTTDGSSPSIPGNSQIIARSYSDGVPAGGYATGYFNDVLISSKNGPNIRVLVSLYANVGSSIDTTIVEIAVEDKGQQVQTSGSITTGGVTPVNTTATAAPVNPVVTKSVEYAPISGGIRSFLPNNTQYAYQVGKGYQGLSPAGYGNLRSMVAFPDVTGLIGGSNVTVNDIWVWMYFEHWYNNAGGYAKIGLHPNPTVPSTWNTNTTVQVTSPLIPKGAGRYVRLPNTTYDGFKSGAWKGFTLLGDSTYNTYGIINSARLKIRYTK